MKYGYKELKGKCKTCYFKCGRVEDLNFDGVERCEYYIKEEDGNVNKQQEKRS